MRILVRTIPTAETIPLKAGPARVVVRSRPQRVLNFDIENRPITYLGSDYTTAQVTAIAWAWTDAPSDVTVRLLGETSLRAILQEFLAVYQQADMLVGHYLRGHDLPMVNGALMEFQLPSLPDKLVHDTKLALMRTKGYSLSQESLSAMFKLDRPKQSMNQIQWREANNLTPEGLAEVRRRAVGDVQQNIELWNFLRKKDYLGPPTMWRSGTAQIEGYVP